MNQEEAKSVQMIYSLYMSGLTFHAVANRLTEMGIRTPGGKDVWNQSAVESLLTNEKGWAHT